MRIICQQSDGVRPCKRRESIGGDLLTLEENRKEAGLQLNEKVLPRCFKRISLLQFVVGKLVLKVGI